MYLDHGHGSQHASAHHQEQRRKYAKKQTVIYGACLFGVEFAGVKPNASELMSLTHRRPVFKASVKVCWLVFYAFLEDSALIKSSREA